jgi:hypothetical protein
LKHHLILNHPHHYQQKIIEICEEKFNLIH